ncbi:MAG TPA: response regulator [Candidatus Limnocylindria bacterium]|nr:response regulator [Candidatus Limnocylindria bacterium]
MDSPYDYRRFAVLYVDDEELSLKQFNRALGGTFRVLTANNADEGMRLLQANQDEIGVILSDQRMPGVKGVQFLEKARQLRPKIIRILVTAYTDVEVAIDAVNSGAIYKYISKPWEVPNLEMVLKRSLEFFIVQRERDALLKEKLGAIQRMMITDRVLGLGIMAAGLGHHVRNAMSAVRTFLELTPEMLHRENIDLDQLRNPGFWQDFHQKVEDRVRRLIEVLDGISITADSAPRVFGTEVVLREVVERGVSSIRTELAAHQILVNNSIPVDLPVMHVDGSRFQRLFELLLRDEVATLQSGAQIWIDASLLPATADTEQRIEIRLRDNGPGLPHDAILSVFDPFFVRSENPQEFGLNLMACFFIVHHHGGTIDVQNVPEGGLLFRMELPLRAVLVGQEEGAGDFLSRVMTNDHLWERLLAQP